MIASDLARSAKQQAMYGKQQRQKTPIHHQHHKKRENGEVGTVPIKKFIKMIDFRQDDLRNIKKFMQSKEQNGPEIAKQESRKSLVEKVPQTKRRRKTKS